MNALFSVPKFSQDSYALVFDIESATVGVAIAHYKKKDSIEILFTHRTRIEYKDAQGAEHLATAVGDAIFAAGDRALEALGRMPKAHKDYSVHAIVHAPWANSQTQRADGVLPEEVPVTRELLQEFMAQHLPHTKTEGRVQFDQHITRIELNGYATTDPYNKKAKHIAITALKSTMADAIHAGITEALREILPNHDVHIGASLFATMQLQEFFGGNDAYTLVDIGGEYTSLSVIRNGTLAGSTSTSFGSEHLIRAVSSDDDEKRQTAVSELTMYLNNACTPAQCRKVEESLDSVEGAWVRAFGDASAKLSKLHRLPTKTFVTVGMYGTWFERMLGKIDFGQFTVTGQPLEPRILLPENAQRKITYKEKVKHDALLALGVLFVDK